MANHEATTHADLYHRHGSDPGDWEEQPTVTGRPNDTPLRGEDKPAVPNSTFGQRAKSQAANEKAVAPDDTENKSVQRRRSSSRKTAK